MLSCACKNKTRYLTNFNGSFTSMAELKTAFAGHPGLISGISLEYIKEICIIPYLFTKDLAEFGFEFKI